MILVGLFLIPVALFIILQLKKFNINKIKRKLLNIFLIALSFAYLYLCLTLKTEPFNYDIQGTGDVFLFSSTIFIFSPFLWIVLFHYCHQLFRNMRVRKNAKIKSSNEFIYYRDDLDRISPSIIMFISMMDIDVRKAVSSVILKLKLLGFVEENNNRLRITKKDTNGLLESEKFVLTSISKETFHEKTYRDLVKKEALNNKYIKRNNHGIFIKIIKMLIIITFPIIFCIFSVKLDDYVFENYRMYKEDDGVVYVHLNNDDQIEKLYYEVTDKNDYYHRTVEPFGKKEISYDYSYIRADRLNYGVVRLAQFLNISVPISISLSTILFFASAFKLVEQLIYLNKNYSRTVEGNKLLNKAYALKNYLNDYSLMKNRTQNELILWEYYMIYAVILDVNTKIENEIVENYLKDMALN